MTKRNPALFFVATCAPYVVGSLAMSTWLAGIDVEAVLFAMAAATSLSGLLTLVHEVEFPAPATNEVRAAVTA